MSNFLEDTMHHSDICLIFLGHKSLRSSPCKLFSALSTWSCRRSDSNLGKVFHQRSNSLKTIFFTTLFQANILLSGIFTTKGEAE